MRMGQLLPTCSGHVAVTFEPSDFGGDDHCDTTAPDDLRASVINFFQYLPTGDFEWTPFMVVRGCFRQPVPIDPPSLPWYAVHPFIGPIGLPSFDTFWTRGHRWVRS